MRIRGPALCLLAALACPAQAPAPPGKEDPLRYVPLGFEAATGAEWIMAACQQGPVRVPGAISHRETGLEFVLVPDGAFLMGAGEKETGAGRSEYPRHKVIVRHAFFLSRTEVTNRQFRLVFPGHRGGGAGLDGDEQPAVMVDWHEARAFCEMFGFRLPAEAEWEYACRGGTEGPFSFVGGMDRLADHGWFAGNSSGRTNPVSRKNSNPLGLYDMHGNAWEWCEDRWHADYGQAPGLGDPWYGSSTLRVVRGGGWWDGAVRCRSTSRDRFEPGTRLPSLGFRPALGLLPGREERAPRPREPGLFLGKTPQAPAEPAKSRHIPKGCWPQPGTPWRRVRRQGKELLVPQGIVHVETRIELVLIPAGSFWMGARVGEKGLKPNERPWHKVEIDEPFYLGRCEVTEGQYGRYHSPAGHDLGDGARPAAGVKWQEARDFCAGFGLRLPSEAEWEYACRGGTAGPYSFAGDEGLLAAHAWYDANSAGRPRPCGQKRPNPFGLYDMHGNVWEWCEDLMHGDYFQAPTDGRPWIWKRSGDQRELRVLRGGSWREGPHECRCATRKGEAHDIARPGLGFRAARSLE